MLTNPANAARAARSLATLAQVARPAVRTPVRASTLTRTFASSSRSLNKDDLRGKAKPLEQQPFASTKDDVVVPYPEDSSRHPRDDVGHNTTGGRVGRHTQRTLASFSMEGKVCVVTGAARGIGNLIARTFVESGANHVAIVDLNEEECKHAAKEVEEWFTKHGGVQPGELDIQG